MDELSIWALQDDDTVEVVKTVSKADLAEKRLEGMLVQRPDMLEPGIRLVGRQTPTEGGPSDLLGVDRHGRLVVFELKRDAITRNAVTQCIDYASALDAKNPNELAEHIAEQSGRFEIKKIENFQEWYEERFPDNEPSDLLPPRLVLVGLGVDDDAERMARFLQAGKIDISVLTFYGFQHDGKTLLARQVEVEAKDDDEGDSNTRRRRYKTASEKRRDFERALDRNGLPDLFESIRETLTTALPSASQKTGSASVSFALRFGSGSFVFLHIWVHDKGGFLLQLHAQPETYDAANLSVITEKARQLGWNQWDRGDGFNLFIKGAEDWGQKHSAVTEFLQEAADLRRKAPAP